MCQPGPPAPSSHCPGGPAVESRIARPFAALRRIGTGDASLWWLTRVRGRPQSLEPLLVHAVDVRPGLPGLANDPVTVRHEALGLLEAAQIGGRKAEHANCCRDHRVALGGPAADGIVLGEDHPAVLAGVAQPDLIWQALCSLLPVDIRH